MCSSLVLIVRIGGRECRATADTEYELVVALRGRQGRKAKREYKCRNDW
jgi:hypothetical protein